jgi:hypothetical protein
VILRIPTSSMDRATSTLRAMDEVADVERRADGDLRVVVGDGDGSPRNGEVTNEILERLIDAKVQVQGFEVEGSRLSDVFMALTDEGSS